MVKRQIKSSHEFIGIPSFEVAYLVVYTVNNDIPEAVSEDELDDDDDFNNSSSSASSFRFLRILSLKFYDYWVGVLGRERTLIFFLRSSQVDPCLPDPKYCDNRLVSFSSFSSFLTCSIFSTIRVFFFEILFHFVSVLLFVFSTILKKLFLQFSFFWSLLSFSTPF